MTSSADQPNGAHTADPLEGQYGHLSADQEAKFTEFKKTCETDGVYDPSKARPTTLSDPDLLRFLRARKFDVGGALKQLKDTETWRQVNKLDELYDTCDVDAFEEALKVYHQWTGRRDLSGHPVYVYEIANIKNNLAAFDRSSKIAHSSAPPTPAASDPIPPKLRMLCALYENMSEFVLPLCNAVPGRPHPEIPVTATSHIVDVSGLGLMGYWNLKNHMQAASTLASTYHPETLDRVFLIGAPSFFPTVWGWIKRWFDPVTTSKIFVLAAADVQPTLTRFMRPADLPVKYGGELEWEYGMPPSFDSEIAKVLRGRIGEGGWVRGPLRWVSDGKGGGRIEMRGTVEGKRREEEVVGEFKP
ncbi:CRAL-TRIO domain-containing protein [Favolaschia claudopus]|uniref:CRAL-TRIO domain-containing protein n=1 Tax=Favolaschia claudopus TaxID=2862362 RepID=A0AAW0C9P5_9AGAR